MSETIGIDEYFHSYLPSLIEKRLAEKTLPDMEGTVFTIQFTIEGERSLSYGITISDARRFAVSPGGIENPMISIRVSEDFIRPLIDFVSSMVSRKQYDAAGDTKGKLELDVDMPGDWMLPVSMMFNGSDVPELAMRGESAELMKIVTGEVTAPTAFMQGKIKIEGDLVFGMSLAKLFM
jgi:hypothetical protein